MDDWLDALDNHDKQNSAKPDLRALDSTKEEEGSRVDDTQTEKTPEETAPAVEEKPKPKAKTKPAAEKEPAVSRPDSVDKSEKKPAKDKKSRGVALPIALGVGVFALVGAGAFAFLAQMGDSSEDTASQEHSQQSSPVAEEADQQGPQPVSDTSSEVAEVGTRCSGNNDVDVSAEDSPRAAIAKFEKAYFDADANGVKASLTKDSDMQKQNWMKILPKAAPKGTTWCLTMQPSEGDTTSVELEVKQPKEEKPTLYKQKVTAKEANGSWAVDSIGRED
ncbi:hypothetical protein [Corynebacterium sp. MSK204]|uniref:hypothetical protein n=1 Tax=Corynebacterium sp. MSK204 TaxID=3050217 RepID=UPI00254EAD94|nr:hypothetical protein [Corynebacterium sp. MSK204]MDK8659946.1 hypothetical protein [Corynebacterium sp. MSK204]